MQRLWFKVWVQGKELGLPILVDDLPRSARITGHVATRCSRDRALAEVYVLAASAEEAAQGFEEARDHLFEE